MGMVLIAFIEGTIVGIIIRAIWGILFHRKNFKNWFLARK